MVLRNSVQRLLWLLRPGTGSVARLHVMWAREEHISVPFSLFSFDVDVFVACPVVLFLRGLIEI